MAMEKVDLYLKTNDGAHELAVYMRGNPEMPVVIYLHGGPGDMISETNFRFFDLEKWFVVAFDQRGCGNSRPFGSLVNNDTPRGVEDIETIRKYLGIDKWLVFGGSYGSTLSLAYAISYPEKVTQLVIRGIFLARPQDMKWSFEEGGASLYHPDTFESYKNFIDKDKQDHLMQAYYEIFQSDDDELKRKACKTWANWEMSLITLEPFTLTKEITDYDITSSLLECHFMVNNMGWNDENYILNNIQKIENIPTYIVQGRYDQDCPPIQAWELKKRLKNIKSFKITEASGHISGEPRNEAELIRIMAEIASER